GLMVKRWTNLPWIADLRDPWYTNSSHKKTWFPWARWERFLEKQVMARADRIIANTPITCADLQRSHPRWRDKITYVTNGFDAERFGPPPPLRQQNERLTILHAGELYCGRDPRSLLDALRTLDQARPPGQAPARFLLLGQSTENRFDLRSAIEQRGLEHVVEIGGQGPYSEALAAMTQSDILLLLDTPRRG